MYVNFSLINGKGMQIKSIKGVGISSGSNKYEHDDAMRRENNECLLWFFFTSSSFSLLRLLMCVSFLVLFYFIILFIKMLFMIVWALIFIICLCEEGEGRTTWWKLTAFEDGESQQKLFFWKLFRHNPKNVHLLILWQTKIIIQTFTNIDDNFYHFFSSRFSACARAVTTIRE